MKMRPDTPHNMVVLVILCFSCLPASGQSEQSGRLFTTPAERLILDQARRQQNRDRQLTLTGRPDQASIPDQKTLGGYVIRNGVRTTTWINDMSEDKTDQINSIQLSQHANQTPAILIKTESGKPVKISVGDTVDMHTGTVRKVYESYQK